MKVLLACILLTISSYAKAQMTLKKTYTNTRLFQSVNIEDEGRKYILYDILNDDIKLYNPDHSIYKTIDSHLPSGATPTAFTCVSKKLFDNDNNIELAFSYANAGQSSTLILKDDGSIVKIFSDVSYCIPRKMENDWTIEAYKTSSIEIYSVPGQYLGLRPVPGNDEAKEADAMLYPNPMSTAATLSYTLPGNVHNASVEVYNTAGVKVRTYQVTDQFHDVLLNRNELPAGNYFYTVKGFGMNSVSNKFTIQ